MSLYHYTFPFSQPTQVHLQSETMVVTASITRGNNIIGKINLMFVQAIVQMQRNIFYSFVAFLTLFYPKQLISIIWQFFVSINNQTFKKISFPPYKFNIIMLTTQQKTSNLIRNLPIIITSSFTYLVNKTLKFFIGLTVPFFTHGVAHFQTIVTIVATKAIAFKQIFKIFLSNVGALGTAAETQFGLIFQVFVAATISAPTKVGNIIRLFNASISGMMSKFVTKIPFIGFVKGIVSIQIFASFGQIIFTGTVNATSSVTKQALKIVQAIMTAQTSITRVVIGDIITFLASATFSVSRFIGKTSIFLPSTKNTIARALTHSLIFGATAISTAIKQTGAIIVSIIANATVPFVIKTVGHAQTHFMKGLGIVIRMSGRTWNATATAIASKGSELSKIIVSIAAVVSNSIGRIVISVFIVEMAVAKVPIIIKAVSKTVPKAVMSFTATMSTVLAHLFSYMATAFIGTGMSFVDFLISGFRGKARMLKDLFDSSSQNKRK